jgi:hypothetical protein
MLVAHPKVFEQYEYRNWLITITDPYCDGNVDGFATPTKYSHLIKNQFDVDIRNVNEEEDLPYISWENDDFRKVSGLFEGFTPNDMLTFLIEEIKEISEEGTPEFYIYHPISTWINDFRKKEIIVLKQINKKTLKPKSSKKHRGFMQVAWSSLVKERDKKCTECGSLYDLHAHHINSYKTHPEKRWDVNNGTTLCGECHRNYHSNNGYN